MKNLNFKYTNRKIKLKLFIILLSIKNITLNKNIRNYLCNIAQFSYLSLLKNYS